MDDDGTREYAVRGLGEDAVRALEVEVVKAHRDRLNPGTFVALGIPTASILEGLGREPGATAPTRPEHAGLSVRARGRLDQAVALSKGRIAYRRPMTGPGGAVSVRIEANPAAGQSPTVPAAVQLTRRPDGEVALQLHHHERPVPGTDAQAADVLGLAAVAGQKPALRPPGVHTARPEERADLAVSIGSVDREWRGEHPADRGDLTTTSARAAEVVVDVGDDLDPPRPVRGCPGARVRVGGHAPPRHDDRPADRRHNRWRRARMRRGRLVAQPG